MLLYDAKLGRWKYTFAVHPLSFSRQIEGAGLTWANCILIDKEPLYVLIDKCLSFEYHLIIIDSLITSCCLEKWGKSAMEWWRWLLRDRSIKRMIIIGFLKILKMGWVVFRVGLMIEYDLWNCNLYDCEIVEDLQNLVLRMFNYHTDTR